MHNVKKFSTISIIDPVKLPPDALAELQRYSTAPIHVPKEYAKTDEERIHRIGDADAILGSWNLTITEQMLQRCPNVKYVGVCGTNTANIDLEAVQRRGITLKNVYDYGDEATAEYIFTQLLMLMRGFGTYQWRDEPAELNGKTIGIVGLGAVGQQVARIALGFNMNVRYHSKTRKPEWESRGLTHLPLNELLSSSDIVTLHVPKNLVILHEKQFNAIRPSTILVDTCLGVVFDTDAFMRWINRGENYVIFDALKKELFENKSISPHIIGLTDVTAGITAESRERLGKKVIANITQYLSTTS